MSTHYPTVTVLFRALTHVFGSFTTVFKPITHLLTVFWHLGHVFDCYQPYSMVTVPFQALTHVFGSFATVFKPITHVSTVFIQKTMKLNTMKPIRKPGELSELLTTNIMERFWKLLCRHNNINPSAICVGDIVEAQISFEGIWLKGNRSKMIVILRAIMVLDKGVHDVSVSVSPTASLTNRF